MAVPGLLGQIGLLMLIRVLGILALVPVLGGRNTPNLVKICLGLAVTAFCLSRHALPGSPEAWDLPVLGGLALKEAAVGLLLGFLLLVVVAALQAAGELMGFQMMFSAASTFSQMTQEQVTVLGQWMYILGMLVFLALEGPQRLVAGMDRSFQILPVWAAPRSWGNAADWLKLFAEFFRHALQLSLPLLTALLVTNVTMGLIARTLPQINLLIVGLPIQILVGFLVLALMLVTLVPASGGRILEWSKMFHYWVGQMGR